MAKKLLNEATVRRFQKLASVSPINEMYQKNEYLKEEEDMDDAPEAMDDAPEAMDDAPEAMDDVEEGDIEVEITDEQREAIIAFADQLRDEEGDLAPMEMGDEDMGAEDELMEALRGVSYVPSKSEIVNEVAQRVARRLKAAKLHEAKLNRALGKRR
jgi:hypothetical protein